MDSSARPAFDPRTDLRAVVQGQRMSVYLDGEERIEQGLVIAGGDPLVAVRACPCCEHFECELIEGYAAGVRRFGPYVLWIMSWGERHVFALERYREVFGDGVEALPGPQARDFDDLDEPMSLGAWHCPDGRVLSFDATRWPDWPLARLAAWRGEPAAGIEAVAPPARAIELRGTLPGTPSLWLDERPREGGRRAAFLPGVFRLPVWIMSPDVDLVVLGAVGERRE